MFISYEMDRPEIMENKEWYVESDKPHFAPCTNLIPTNKCPPDVAKRYLKWAKKNGRLCKREFFQRDNNTFVIRQKIEGVVKLSNNKELQEKWEKIKKWI